MGIYGKWWYQNNDDLDVLKKDKELIMNDWKNILLEVSQGIINREKISSTMHRMNCIDARIIKNDERARMKSLKSKNTKSIGNISIY